MSVPRQTTVAYAIREDRFHLPAFTSVRHRVSSYFFRTPKRIFVEYLPVKKVDVLSIFLQFNYVNLLYCICGRRLWKTPVDKSVEIVEKSWFSTGISWFWKLQDLCKNAKTWDRKREKKHNFYVTSPNSTGYLMVETMLKSSGFVQTVLFLPLHTRSVALFFVNYRQPLLMYIWPRRKDTILLPKTTQRAKSTPTGTLPG